MNRLQQLSREPRSVAVPTAPADRTVTTVTASAGVDDRSVRQTVRRLAREHPQVPPETIASQLDEALARTAEAKVQTFRLLLAERQIRNRLTPRGAPQTQPTATGPQPVRQRSRHD